MRSIQRQNLQTEATDKLAHLYAEMLVECPMVTSADVADRLYQIDPILNARVSELRVKDYYVDLVEGIRRVAKMKDIADTGQIVLIVPECLKDIRIHAIIQVRDAHGLIADMASYKAQAKHLKAWSKISSRNRVMVDKNDDDVQVLCERIIPVMEQLGPTCTLSQALAYLKGMEGGENGRPN